jgi:hypothetical protein
MYMLVYKCSFRCFDSENRANITVTMYMCVYVYLHGNGYGQFTLMVRTCNARSDVFVV